MKMLCMFGFIFRWNEIEFESVELILIHLVVVE